jgi:hypothetical protein
MSTFSYADNQGVLTFPLFHGTSDYFLESIKKDGLAGRNVIEDWRLLEFFGDVIDACRSIEDKEFSEVLNSRLPSLDRILGRSPHNVSGFNWRYGHLYLAADWKKAATYAIRGQGSELLRIALGWYTDLARLAPAFAAELLSEFPEIAAASKATHKPIVLKIERVDLEHLATETGQTGEPLTRQLQDWVEFDRQFSDSNVTTNCSFEYVGPALPASRLEVFDVHGQLQGYYPMNLSLTARK